MLWSNSDHNKQLVKSYLSIKYCQEAEKGWGQVDRQSGRHKMCFCLASLEDTVSYHSIICHFFVDLLTTVRLVSLFLSLLPVPLPLTSLCLFPLPFAACANLWSRSSDESKMYYSAAPSHTNTDTVFVWHACAQLCLCGSECLLWVPRWMR